MLKPIFEKMFGWIVIESIEREEAARMIMEREVTFKWSPQIIDTPIKNNIVNFDELKRKKVKKKYV
jgi:hypothetical protein